MGPTIKIITKNSVGQKLGILHIPKMYPSGGRKNQVMGWDWEYFCNIFVYIVLFNVFKGVPDQN